MIGAIIDGRYRIIRELGAGAMGAVYEAEHTGTGGRVALKLITGDITRNREAVSRFQREAKAAGVVDTQYVTKVYDTGVDRETGLPFLAMEFLTGQDLHGFLKKSAPIAPDLALRIIAQACIGLQKAHDANVVHRDIKPANMFLARREEGEVVVKLLDFGIAKVKMEQAQETESAGLTKTGSLLGSPLYMSPEQALGSKDVDHRADIWSLGATLYQALAGRTPFSHITSLGLLIVEISSGHLPAVQEFAPWVSPQVAAIVHGALRRNRNERFQSASDMLAAIRPLLPQGFGIHESMLVPLDASARLQVQPRLPQSSTPSLPEGPLQALIPDGTPAASQYLTNPGTTAGALARSQGTVQARPSSLLPVLAGGAAFVAIMGVGVGGYLFLRKTPPAPAAVQAAKTSQPEAPSALPPAPPAPAPGPAPTASATATAEPALPTFKLVVSPGDVSVEVDGQLVQAKDGLVELTGAYGSKKQVRIFKYRYSTVKDVFLTDQGPVPSKLELSYSVTRSPGSTQGTPTKTTTPKSGPKTKFE